MIINDWSMRLACYLKFIDFVDWLITDGNSFIVDKICVDLFMVSTSENQLKFKKFEQKKIVKFQLLIDKMTEDPLDEVTLQMGIQGGCSEIVFRHFLDRICPFDIIHIIQFGNYFLDLIIFAIRFDELPIIRILSFYLQTLGHYIEFESLYLEFAIQNMSWKCIEYLSATTTCKTMPQLPADFDIKNTNSKYVSMLLKSGAIFNNHHTVFQESWCKQDIAAALLKSEYYAPEYMQLLSSTREGRNYLLQLFRQIK